MTELPHDAGADARLIEFADSLRPLTEVAEHLPPWMAAVGSLVEWVDGIVEQLVSDEFDQITDRYER